MQSSDYASAVSAFDGNNPKPLRTLLQSMATDDITHLITWSTETAKKQIANSWLIKAWVDAGNILTGSQLESFTKAYLDYSEWGAKLHYYQILQTHDVPDKLKPAVYQAAYQDTKHAKAIVRAWAFYTLAKSASDSNKSTTRTLLEKTLAESSGSVAVRVKKALELI